MAQVTGRKGPPFFRMKYAPAIARAVNGSSVRIAQIFSICAGEPASLVR